jgi:hypothetical protein
MSYRFQHFIKINRENFIKNKKMYTEFIAKNKHNKQKNHNKIIIRKMSTNNNSYSRNDNGPKMPFWYMAAAACGVYISSKFTYKKCNNL